MMFWYRYYKKGLMPDDGAVSRQAYKVTQLFQSLDAYFAEAEDAARQEAEEKAGRRGRE